MTEINSDLNFKSEPMTFYIECSPQISCELDDTALMYIVDMPDSWDHRST